MAEMQRYEYDGDVVQTGRVDRLHSNLNDRGRKGWRLAHVVPYTGRFAAHGTPGDLLLVWERPLTEHGREVEQ